MLHKSIWIKELKNGRYYVFNGRTKKSYEFGEKEINIMQSINGNGDHNTDKLGLNDIDAAKKERFVKLLDSLGFLENSKINRHNNILNMKIGLINLSKYLDETSSVVNFVKRFIKTGFVLFFIVGILSILIAKVDIIELVSSYQFSSSNILLTIAIVLFVLSLHEIAHAFFAISYGIPIPDLGLMLYWFIPCAYADVSSIHLLKKDSEKIQVLAAGIYLHIMLIGIGMIILSIMPSSIGFSLPLIAINFLMIVGNSAFYLKLDGYYILTILLGDANLREKSLDFIRMNKNPIAPLEKDIFSKMVYIICGVSAIAFVPVFILMMGIGLMPIIISIYNSILLLITR